MNYQNITTKWLSKRNLNIKKIKNATYLVKNGQRYYVNKNNKIKHENNEVANAKWFIDTFGGTLVYLPKIDENGGIPCADYKYYFANSSKGFFLEEKETSGKSKNVFYHALENKQNQANIFLIDCTKSNFTNKEIYRCLEEIFKCKRTSYVKTVIVKNKNKLFGVFTKKIRDSALRSNGGTIS